MDIHDGDGGQRIYSIKPEFGARFVTYLMVIINYIGQPWSKNYTAKLKEKNYSNKHTEKKYYNLKKLYGGYQYTEAELTMSVDIQNDLTNRTRLIQMGLKGPMELKGRRL